MDDSVALVVSGIVHPGVKKINLIDSSSYFRALLSGNYKDSFRYCYEFRNWPSSAFHVLLQYIVTGKIELRNRDLNLLRTAMDIADYLFVGGFKPQLARTLVTSWTSMITDSALELAVELGVLNQLKEHSIFKVLNAKDQEPSLCALQTINYDLLILVTEMNKFWKFRFDNFESNVSIRNKAIQRCCEILQLAVHLPVRAKKVKVLVQNLPVEIWNRRSWLNVVKTFDEPGLSSRYLKTALEDRLVDIRQNLRNRLLHIRFAFTKGDYKIKTFGVLEFNLNSWSWEIQKHEGKFSSFQCVMNRDYATFIGPSGLFVVRRRKRQAKMVEHAEFGKINTVWSTPTCCVSGKYIFIIVNTGFWSWNTLLQFNIFDKTLTECVQVQIRTPKLIPQGNSVYIVGYGMVTGNLPELNVYYFCAKTKCVSLLLCVKLPDLYSLGKAVKIKSKFYFLGDSHYFSLDTLGSADQNLEYKRYIGLVCELWDFIMLDVGQVSDGMIFLLRSKRYPSAYLVARFNPDTGEIKGIGVLPDVSEGLMKSNIRDSLPVTDQWVQMETRKKKHGSVQNNVDILQRMRSFDS